MRKLIILLTMLFLHIIDDYVLQDALARLKQRSYWKEHAPDEKYKHDYIIALIEHSFEWTFMVMLPITIKCFILNYGLFLYVVCFLANVIIHTIVDDLKANKLKINLIQDQCVHIVQVLITWFVLGGIFK
jgi:hypothetical protein